MKNKEYEALPAIGKTVWELREFLFDEIEQLQDGRSSPARAQAVARLATQILESAKIEVVHGKALQKAIETKALLTEGKKRVL